MISSGVRSELGKPRNSSKRQRSEAMPLVTPGLLMSCGCIAFAEVIGEQDPHPGVPRFRVGGEPVDSATPVIHGRARRCVRP